MIHAADCRCADCGLKAMGLQVNPALLKWFEDFKKEAAQGLLIIHKVWTAPNDRPDFDDPPKG
jgi:hypothetical protein